jgi:outer membrane protein TolC
MNTSASLAFLILSPGLAAAQSEGDVEESSKNGSVVTINRAMAIQRVLDENPEIRATQAEVMVAEARTDQVDAAKYPSLDVTVGVASSLAAENSDQDENGVRSSQAAYGEFDLGQLRPAFLGRLTATQPIHTFGKIGLREEAAEAGLKAARAQGRMGAADVLIQVAMLYESHLYAKDVLLFVKDIQQVAERSIEETEARLDVGAFDVSPQDLLRLKTALGAANLIENFANAALSQTSEGLRAYLGYPPGTKIETEEDYLDPVNEQATALEDLIALARDQRPELVALSQGIEAYDKLADAEYADWFPNLFALGFVSGAWTPDRDQQQSRFVVDPLNHFVAGALVGAQWKIQWDSATHRAAEIRAEAFRLEQLQVWATSGLPAEVNRYHREVTRARADIEQLKITLPVTQEWVVRASADYAAGFEDSRGVTDAVAAFVRMKNNELDAVYRLNLNLAELAKATGTLGREGGTLYPGE